MSEIAQYLGHRDDRTTQRIYARFSPEYLREAAKALDVPASTVLPAKVSTKARNRTATDKAQ